MLNSNKPHTTFFTGYFTQFPEVSVYEHKKDDFGFLKIGVLQKRSKYYVGYFAQETLLLGQTEPQSAQHIHGQTYKGSKN